MRAFNIKIKNDADWTSDGAITIEILVLAEDFISATMKAHEISDEVRNKLLAIASGDSLSKDLESLRIQDVQETCPVVVEGVGEYLSDLRNGPAAAADKVVARLAKRKE